MPNRQILVDISLMVIMYVDKVFNSKKPSKTLTKIQYGRLTRNTKNITLRILTVFMIVLCNFVAQ